MKERIDRLLQERCFSLETLPFVFARVGGNELYGRISDNQPDNHYVARALLCL